MITEEENQKIRIKQFELIDICNWCRSNNITCDECLGLNHMTGKHIRPCVRNIKISEFTDYLRNEEYKNEIS